MQPKMASNSWSSVPASWMLRLQTLHAGSARIQQTSKETNDFYRDFLQKNEISPFYNFLMEHKLISHAILIPPPNL